MRRLGLPGLIRHWLRHTALTWMPSSGVQLPVLQRVAGHKDPAVTSRHLHPDVRVLIAAGTSLSVWWDKARAGQMTQTSEQSRRLGHENGP